MVAPSNNLSPLLSSKAGIFPKGNLLRYSGVLLVTKNSTGGVSNSRPATAAAARIYARVSNSQPSQPSDMFTKVQDVRL